MKRVIALVAALTAATASSAPFTVIIQNTATNGYGWSAGLLTLQPLISVGPSPRTGNPYFTYQFANSHCPNGVTTDNGNATLLAQNWGLTIGTNAWLVPALPAGTTSIPITFDAPVGSRLSFIAWVNDTSVFDDFVAMHPPGDVNTLSVPLFNGTTPVENIDFVIGGYDTNSTSATDGSGGTCTPECPAPATGCFVAPGNASQGSGGGFNPPATPNVTLLTASSSVTQNRFRWNNIGPHQGVVVARNLNSAVTWLPTNGRSYTAGQFVGTAATGTITNASRNQTGDGDTFTLNDGINPVTVFEFNKTGGTTAGRVPIDITAAGLSTSQVGDAIVLAINGVGASLRITATKAAAQPHTLLANDVEGTAGNQLITDNASNQFSSTGMAGGVTTTTQIAYVDNGAGASNQFVDTGVAAGARAFYKAFSHANSFQYANGSVPSGNGLLTQVTSSSGTQPKWCYAVGFGSAQQPVTKLGTTVFTSNASGSVTANVTSPGTPTTDGNERWRPVQLGGTTQSRPLLVPTEIGDLLITGDFSGRVTAINPATGAVVWISPVLGTRVQGQPVAQLNDFVGFFAGGPAYQTLHAGRDLIFVGSRNTGSTTNNQVFALSSLNGSIVWTHTPGNLDFIAGGMAVDYERNRLYVGAHNGLRILNSLTGAQVGSLFAGQQFDHGVNLDFAGGVATSVFAVSMQGNAYGVSLATMTQTWTAAIGLTSTWIFPTGNGFVASMTSGELRRYTVSGATATLNWARTGIGIPTGATIDYPNSKIYAGSTDGTLRQVDYNDGGLDKTLVVTSTGSLGVGFPTLDTTVGRLHVGTLDGRVCAFPIPLP